MELSVLNWVDYIIIGIIILSIFVGLIRGFIKETISLIGLIVAIWGAITLSDDLQRYIAPYIDSQSAVMTLSFVVIFVGTLLIFTFINVALSHMVKISGIGVADRVIGIVFGLARGVLFISVLIVLAQFLSYTNEIWWKSSYLIKYFEPFSEWLLQYIPFEINGVTPAQ